MNRSFFHPSRFPLGALVLTVTSLAAPTAFAGTCIDPIPVSTAAASSALGGWPASNIYDNNPGTSWSSAAHPTAAATEWIAYWFSGNAFYDVEYIKLRPRWSGSPLSFPVTFTVYYSNGSSWVAAPGGSVTSYPTPMRDEWVNIPLTGKVSANGIQVVATTLSPDNFGNYYFQLAEASAGCNPDFAPGTGHWQYLGNDGSSTVHFYGVGSGSFDPNKLAVWHAEYRRPLLAPNPGTNDNIYAAQAQWDTTNNRWAVYFGGWDGTPDPHDRISDTTSTDDFATFGSHTRIIDYGGPTYTHANNPSVVQVSPANWRMAYTLAVTATNRNITGYATSSDGYNWTPNVGSSSYLLNTTGYPNWANRDVNGVNVLYTEGSTWHYYFTDFNPGAPCASCIFHATGSDAVNYTYQGVALQGSGCRLINDLKRFTYGATPYYLSGYHCNGSQTWFSVTKDLNNLGATSPFVNEGSNFHAVSLGWVTKGNRLYGALYGGTTNSGLVANNVYATWLQKQVSFASSDGTLTQGQEWAYGPNEAMLILNQQPGTIGGLFRVYDSDSATLLYTSPTLTLRAGDRWQYLP